MAHNCKPNRQYMHFCRWVVDQKTSQAAVGIGVPGWGIIFVQVVLIKSQNLYTILTLTWWDVRTFSKGMYLIAHKGSQRQKKISRKCNFSRQGLRTTLKLSEK